MAKRIEDFEIIGKQYLTDDIFILELSAEDILPVLLPGQLVQVRIDGSPETFLRRPFSIHDADFNTNRIKLLIQVAGKGTAVLSKLNNGDHLNLVYPLGNSFSNPSGNEKILLVGGGCGVAPLLFLGKHLNSQGYVPDILLGFRNSTSIIEYKEYGKTGRVFLTTEDGSAGEKGYVTQHPVLEAEKYDRLYCCGPDPMLKAMARYAGSKGIQCEVTLENLMACGIGVCLCCVVETVRGNLCTCIDGPVFKINDLKW